MPLLPTTVLDIAIAVTDQTEGNEIAGLINRGDAIASQSARTAAFSIVATSTSTTVDFASLVVGDVVFMAAAGAGGAANAYMVTTAGTLPAAAVVGNTYLVFRATAAALAAAVTNVKF